MTVPTPPDTTTTTTTTTTTNTNSHGNNINTTPLPLSTIQSTKLLVVGAGGIGCELLKNLSLSGFTSIDVIDLDTIDISNLNRQFLFRKHHVGKPKCVIACEAATKMSPRFDEAKFTAHHSKIQDFDVSFFKTFTVVLNALDNVDARRYVNRMCLASGVPLVEAGSTGYLGQCTVIDKASGVECYECQSKPTPKVYPICTIRSTPSQPVHCIVWAKELYKLMFGLKEESMLWEDMEGDEKSLYVPVVTEKPTFPEGATMEEKKDSIKKYTENVLTALFNTEIDKQLKMDRYKTAKCTPAPLPASLISEGTSSSSSSATTTNNPSAKTIPTPLQSISSFHRALTDLLLLPTPPPGEFDKDHYLIMSLVTSASNLRAHLFSIPLQSLYDAKGIAGNIIPAIATTNAIIAGLQVLQLYQILRDSKKIKENCRYSYCLRDKTRKGYYVQPVKLPPPNPNCFVCRNAKLEIKLNVSKWTLAEFIKRVVKAHLGFGEPTLLINEGGDVIHEEGDGADEEVYKVNLPKLLKELPAGGLKDGGMVRIEDFSQNLEVDGVVIDEDVMGEDGEEISFAVVGEEPKVREETAKKDEGKDDDDDDDIEVVAMDGEEKGTKRKSDDVEEMSEGDASPKKRRKVDNGGAVVESVKNCEVIEID
mmetsp:Transcript_9356/g.11551  ORF Transcript_9356/g.11551 Transcript_9356/m.11551 type:complete len:649 (+) Transcript_9356:135-2081(+)|eukprot:CAMPEP_0172506296 /NCGR_PEP_ID=MMETSP1066-20121228/193652_1 /TAXON_ID=671091 /ORGANISM="Coscinodiscus wailesii, Strain CCMP2513" /LENGTH=648 /DNA_ID=CAMNT_0013283265 /DNA_START=130 /DNA_END=2076 /DNA_ORIENTATION=+